MRYPSCRILPISALLLGVILLLAACKNSGSPESVAKKFLESFSQMDYKTAKGLSTKNTWGLLDIMAHYTDSIPAEQKAAIIHHFDIEITGSEKESDTTVIVSYKSKPKLLPFNKLRLIKHVDRYGHVRWKVDISTLDLVGGLNFYNKAPAGRSGLLPDSAMTPTPE